MLGIVTFYGDKKHIGGGFVPALALKSWCDKMSIAADVVAFASPEADIDPRVDVTLYEGYEVMLNAYDRLYFITPPIFYHFDAAMVKTPFMFMVHGEGDLKLYKDTQIGLSDNPNCLGVVDIVGPGLSWYPCCLPEDLITEPVEFSKGDGILYAARVCNWVNIDLMLELCDESRASCAVFGAANNPETHKKVSTTLSQCEIGLEVFDKVNIPYEEFEFFWDCIGNDNKPFWKNRISLSAWEALKRGLVPIVFEGQASINVDDIVLEIPRGCTRDQFRDRLAIFYEYKDVRVEAFNDEVSIESPYEAVKSQVSLILERLYE